MNKIQVPCSGTKEVYKKSYKAGKGVRYLGSGGIARRAPVCAPIHRSRVSLPTATYLRDGYLVQFHEQVMILAVYARMYVCLSAFTGSSEATDEVDVSRVVCFMT